MQMTSTSRLTDSLHVVSRWNMFKKVLLAFLFLLFLACSGPGISVKPEANKGIYHRVKKGETLWSISKTYHIDLQELAEINNIINPALIETGDAIFIPGADQILETPTSELREAREDTAKVQHKRPQTAFSSNPFKKTQKANSDGNDSSARLTETNPADKESNTTPPVQKTHVKNEKKPDENQIEIDRKRFIWPVKGTILSRYGIQANGLKNNGIKIAAQENTPVLASAGGEVTYSDTLKYYGNTIILKHDENFSTVYTSLKSRLVKVGDHVKKGDQIALLGNGETNSKPYLNFEIRQTNKPRNPLFFLP